MANNPVVNIDPDGMWSIPWGNIMSAIGGFLSSMTQTTSWVSLPFMTRNTITTQPNLALGNMFSGAAMLLQAGMDGKKIQDAARELGSTNSTSTDWKPLYKTDLSNYGNLTGQCTSCNDQQLGNFFERIVGVGLRTDPLFTNNNYRENTKKMEQSGERNTVPDFIGDAIQVVSMPKAKSRIEIINNSIWVEVKAKNGDVYNSTSANQIKGHIDNLSSLWSGELSGQRGILSSHFKPKLIIVTTADTIVSNSVLSHADIKGVRVEHLVIHYKIDSSGMWHFRFY
jgi:hypothetical protein